MRILIIGKNGQVGWELQRTLAPLGAVTAIDYPEIDLINPDSIHTWLHQVQPQVVVNAAAYTAVDRAERDLETAHAINAAAPGLLAELSHTIGAALVHYSTDFVFDGKKTEPYTEDDPTAPINAYGRTKLDGELAVGQVGGAAVIFRTAWVYSTRRPCFVTKVLEWARSFPSLRIVTDQVGSPTWARMLAEVTAQVIGMGGASITPWMQERRGVYHLAGNGGASRFDWAQAILANDPAREEQTAEALLPAKSADFPTPALRPAYSILDCGKLENTFGLRLPAWDAALALAMDEMGQA